MATIVHDRDNILQSAGTRVIASSGSATSAGGNLLYNSSFENVKNSETVIVDTTTNPYTYSSIGVHNIQSNQWGENNVISGLSGDWSESSGGQIGSKTFSRVIDSTDRVYGVYGQKVTASNLGTTASDYVRIYQDIDVKNLNGSVFRASAYVKSDNGGAKALIRIEFLLANESVTATYDTAGFHTTSWTHMYTSALTVPVNTAWIRISLYMYQNNIAGPAEYVFDGAILTIGDVIPFYTSGFPDNMNSNISIDATGNITGIDPNKVGTSVANNMNNNVRTPGGGLFTSDGANPQRYGSIKIKLPVAKNAVDTLITFTVDIVENQEGYSCTMVVSGFANSSGVWSQVTAAVLAGSNVEHPAYFGHDNTNLVVWIGAYNDPDPWNYLQVRVRDIFIGFGSTDVKLWETGWVITVDTTPHYSVTGQVLDTLPGADWNKVDNIPESQIYNTYVTPDSLALRLINLDNDTGSNCSYSGNTVTKISGGTAWNAGMHSKEVFTGGAFASAVATITDNIMFGLNEIENTGSYTDITYAIYIVPNGANGLVSIYHEGTQVQNPATAPNYNWTTCIDNDVLSVTYDNYSVKYAKNNVIFYQTAVTNSLPLFFDCSLYQQGATIKGINFGPYASAYGKNLLDISGWKAMTVDDSNDVFPFSPNPTSSGGSNVIKLASLPDGTWGNVWEATSGSATSSNSEGGWNTQTTLAYAIPIDHTKLYRFMVWIKRPTGANGSGTFYLGPINITPAHVAAIANQSGDTGNGTGVTNPYFLAHSRSLLPENVWCLVVGYVFPSTYNNNAVNLSGVWRVDTGEKIIVGTDYRWVSGVTFTNHRSYQYYTTQAGNLQQFWNPKVELADGSEASIGTILSDAALTLAGGKIKTWIQNDIPTASAIGDLWFDLDDDNKLYRAFSKDANSIGTGFWQPYQMGTNAIQDEAATTVTILTAVDTTQPPTLFPSVNSNDVYPGVYEMSYTALWDVSSWVNTTYVYCYFDSSPGGFGFNGTYQGPAQLVDYWFRNNTDNFLVTINATLTITARSTISIKTIYGGVGSSAITVYNQTCRLTEIKK
jgi:hypothetical protein